MGVEVAQETPSTPGVFTGKTHKVLECIQAHPPRNQHQKGPICLWVGQGVTENQQRVEQAVLFPFGPHPTYSITTNQHELPHPGEHLRLCPLLHNRRAKTKKMAQMKEQIKAPEKIQLSNEEIANQSDAEFKTLGIRMLTEMVEYVTKERKK